MVRRLLARVVLKESAITAFLVAERDVDIDGTLICRIRLLRHELCPDMSLLRFIHNHALSAGARVNNALFGKCTAERIRRLCPEQPAARFRRERGDFIL